MKKLVLSVFTFMLCYVGAHAQFSEFDPAIDPQQGDIAVGDINNDGKLDVIFSGRTDGILKGAIMLGNGDGTFTIQDAPNPITPGHFACIKFGDIDGDGDLDVIFNGNGGSINGEPVAVRNGIALNDGNGVFTLAPADKYPIPDATITCGIVDLNNDGRMDYYFAGNGAGNITIYFQEADGSFTADNSSFANTNFVDPEVIVVDFNNDMYPDLFISAWDEIGGSRYSATWANDGFGKFALYPQPNIIRKGYGSASFGDVNGDGYIDLLLNGDGGADGENSSDIFRLYKNENGTFTPVATFNDYRQISVGGGSCFVDWDNDGDLDIILGGWSGTAGRQATMLFECKDAANFTYELNSLSNTALPGVSENTYEVADMNGDGKADLLIMGYNGGQDNQVGKYNKNICGIYLNTTTQAATQLDAPANLASVADGEGEDRMVTLSWDAVAGAGSYNIALRNKVTGKWLYNPMSVTTVENNGWRQVTGMGNAYLNKSWELYELPDGTYEWSVQVINKIYAGGKFADFKEFTLGDGTGMDDASSQQVEVYSRDGSLCVDTQNKSLLVKVYDIAGRLLESKIGEGELLFPLNRGNYIVEVSGDGEPFRTKINL